MHPAAYKLEGHAAGDHDAEVAAHLATCAACNAYVDELRAAAFPLPRKKRDRRPLLAFIPLLAAAAVLVLYFRKPVETPTTPPVASETRFKGGVQLAVVRERDDRQVRLTNEVRIKAGDRLRVEIGVDGSRPVSAGILGKDGSWLVLLAPAMLEAGTHFSERAAKVDARPTEGWVIAGDPEAVERARMSRAWDGVTVIPIAVDP
jgi:predicted anti-sigma-YlaC factor YlaD